MLKEKKKNDLIASYKRIASSKARKGVYDFTEGSVEYKVSSKRRDLTCRLHFEF